MSNPAQTTVPKFKFYQNDHSPKNKFYQNDNFTKFQNSTRKMTSRFLQWPLPVLCQCALVCVADPEGTRANMGCRILNEMGHHSTKFTGGNDEDSTSGCQTVTIHSAKIHRSVLHDGVLSKRWVRRISGGLVANRVGTPKKCELNKESALHSGERRVRSQINNGVWAGSTDLSAPTGS